MKKENIIFTEKGRKFVSSRRKYDVALRVNNKGYLKSDPNRSRVVFRFYGDAIKRVAPSAEYLTFGYVGDVKRVYFMECDSVAGFKLSAVKGNNAIKRITKTISRPNFWLKYEGNYDLIFDKECGLYFIDLARKLK